MCTGVTGVLQFVLTTGVNTRSACTEITKYIRPGNLITSFSSTKIQISMQAGGHFSLFISKENTPNQASLL